MSKGRLQAIDLRLLAWLFASDLHYFIKERDKYMFYPLASFRCSTYPPGCFVIQVPCESTASMTTRLKATRGFESVRVELSTFTTSLSRCLAVWLLSVSRIDCQ